MLLAGGGFSEVETIEPTLAPVKQLVATPVVEIVNNVATGFAFDWKWILYIAIFLGLIWIVKMFLPSKSVK